MIAALAGRVIGPVATLALLGYLAGFPPEYTATYAVLAAYMQFSTAPLNPYTEHFQLREILSGRKRGLGAGLAGIGLICIASAGLVLGLGQSLWVLCIVPLLGLGHLLIKVLAATLRAGGLNGCAITLEFTLRPLVLLLFVMLIFTFSGPSVSGLTWSFAMTGLATVMAALVMTGLVRRVLLTGHKDPYDGPVTAKSSPWAFVFLGMLMVLASQFEVFAMSRLDNAPALATYKVALQLASICGIATNFVLMNNLRELYAHPVTSDAYRVTFRKVRLQTFGVSVVFAVSFALIGLIWPLLWPRETWLLSAAAAVIFAVSAAFGPLVNWYYSAGRLGPVALSLGLMLAAKLVSVAGLALAGMIGPASLLVVYGLGVLTQNLFLLVFRSRVRA